MVEKFPNSNITKYEDIKYFLADLQKEDISLSIHNC